MGMAKEKHRVVPVLIVDDSDYHREDYGYELPLKHDLAVMTARNTTEALAILSDDPSIEILVTNNNMAHQEDAGVQLARKIQPMMPQIRVVILTSRPIAGHLPQNAEVYPKPITPFALYEIIHHKIQG